MSFKQTDGMTTMQHINGLSDEALALIDFFPLPTLVFEQPRGDALDAPHNTFYLNRHFVEKLGYGINEIPDHQSWLKLAFPDDNYRQEVIEQWQQHISRSSAQGASFMERAVKVRCKNGAEHWYRIYSEQGHHLFPGMYMVAFQDFSYERKYKQLQTSLVVKDSLTNVANHAYMLKALDDEVARVNRFGDTFSIIVVYINELIELNEQYGSECSDYVLKTVAGILQSKVRKIDVIARWDKDKFLLLMPKTNDKTAYKVNQIILEKIKNFPFKFNYQPLNIKVTMGIAEYQINENLKNTLERADSTLYLGKAVGAGYIARPQQKNLYTSYSRFSGKE